MLLHAGMKLGKLLPKRDSRTLRLGPRYLLPSLAPPPLTCLWGSRLGPSDWGMMLNDSLGCCTIAAVGHAVQAWATSISDKPPSIPDSLILSYYEKWDGYDPTKPDSDQGGVELDVLNLWRRDGFNEVKLDAYASIHLTPPNIKEAIWLFGGVYLGLELPLTAQDQDLWDVTIPETPDSVMGSWGGHAVYAVGYDSNGVILVTWGRLKHATWAWMARYCSEGYALLSKEWIEITGLAPSGFDLATLDRDLKFVTSIPA